MEKRKMRIDITRLKLVLSLILLSLLLVSSAAIASAAKIEQEVEEKIQSQDEVSVIVVLKDDSAPEPRTRESSALPDREKAKQRLNAKKAMIEKKVSKALSRIQANGGDKEVKVRRKYSTVNGFSGRVTKKGLEKLRNDPDVEAVYVDTPVHAALDSSIPQINADDAWAVQFGLAIPANITGAGQAICIIDSGVDYTHNAFGSCSVANYQLNGNNESYVLESAHDYANNYDHTWAITKPGYTNIALHFKNISLEYKGEACAGCDTTDKVIIYDSNMQEIANYHGINGVITGLWTPYSEGDTIYVRLTTDGSFAKYGFYIDYVLNGTTNTTYNWTSCEKIAGGWDFVNNDADPMDDYGHGTHCAGIAASSNNTFKGAAPDAKIIAIKVLDSLGSGWTSDVVAGIDFCVNNSAAYNISAISMSLGTQTYHNNTYCDSSFPLTASSINSAVGSGIIVFAASGNEGDTKGISSPACIENATPIGAVTGADAIASFTNRQAILDIVAPGVSICSARLPGDSSGTSCGGGFFINKQGTSMATPHAAGAAALLGQFALLQGSIIAPAEIEAALNNTGVQVYDSATGLYYSRIDVYSAVASIDSTPPSFSGAVNYTNSALRRYSTFTANITIDDAIGLGYYLFSTNASGIWENSTAFSLGGIGGYTASHSEAVNASRGSNVCWNYWANDTNGNEGSSGNYCFVVENTNPIVNNVEILPPSASTTSDLNCTYSSSDADENDFGILSVTFDWHLDGIAQGINSQVLSYGNTSGGDNWSCSVNASDGSGFGANSSANKTVYLVSSSCAVSINPLFLDYGNQSNPNQSNVNCSCTNPESPAVLWRNGTDVTADENGTYSTLPVGSWFYECNASATQNYGYAEDIGVIEVMNNTQNSSSGNSSNSSNSSSGGDSSADSDGDGINDTNDALNGDLDNVSTNIAGLNLTIGGSANFSQEFNGVLQVNFTNSTATIVEFSFDFDASSNKTIDLANVTIETQNVSSAAGSIFIKGIDLTLQGTTKTAYIDRKNASLGGVCIKDEEIASITEITSDCTGSGETKVECSGTLQSGYRCTAAGSRYKVEGLSHSGIKQIDYEQPSSPPPRSSGGGGGGGGCSDECESGTSRCFDVFNLEVCEYNLQEGCWKWASTPCLDGYECEMGVCVEAVCVEDWICGEWGECNEGVIRRECADFNGCGAEENKPLVEMGCAVGIEEDNGVNGDNGGGNSGSNPKEGEWAAGVHSTGDGEGDNTPVEESTWTASSLSAFFKSAKRTGYFLIAVLGLAFIAATVMMFRISKRPPKQYCQGYYFGGR